MNSLRIIYIKKKLLSECSKVDEATDYELFFRATPIPPKNKPMLGFSSGGLTMMKRK
jgi:hypothetical protein